MEVVGGAGFEFRYEMQIAVPGLWGLGVDQQTTTADPVRQPDKPGEHVLEKGGA